MSVFLQTLSDVLSDMEVKGQTWSSYICRDSYVAMDEWIKNIGTIETIKAWPTKWSIVKLVHDYVCPDSNLANVWWIVEQLGTNVHINDV